ncbi:hypothetical protein ACEPAF_214 [Sanghuangporus sanghuang]
MVNSTSYTLQVPEGEQFKISVKNYTLTDGRTIPESITPITAFLAHGIGLHKELYEPFLDDLSRLQMEQTPSYCITEVWAIDCPNHGYSALLNEENLKLSNGRFTSPMDYVQCFLALLDSGIVKDLESKQLVFVGHSAGATTVVLTIEELMRRKRPNPFSALILLECPLLGTPMASGAERNDRWINKESPIIAELLRGKRDKWPSRDVALKSLSKSVPFNSWENRVLELYVKHGLRPLPTWFYPDDKDGVTPKCYKIHEVQGFTDSQATLAMSEALPRICDNIPVHLVFAERSFLRPSDKEIELLIGRMDDKYPCDKYASTTLVPGAGHLVSAYFN